MVTGGQVKWIDLISFTWEDLSMNTWGQPLSDIVSIPTEINDTLAIGRKFIKFLKALRWRQINYTVSLLCDGSTAQGPCRIFSLTVVVSSKQTVVKQVN